MCEFWRNILSLKFSMCIFSFHIPLTKVHGEGSYFSSLLIKSISTDFAWLIIFMFELNVSNLSPFNHHQEFPMYQCGDQPQEAQETDKAQTLLNSQLIGGVTNI